MITLLTGAQQVLAALSLTGGLFVLYSVIRWSELRSFAYRCVSMLVLAQVIGSAVHLLPEADEGDPLCYTQALFTSVAWVATMLWSMATAFTLHMAFLQERTTFDSGEIEGHSLVYNTFCWGVSLILALLPLTTNSYGRNPVGQTIDDDGEENDVTQHHSASCWLLTTGTTPFVWRIIQVYIPMWLATIYCIWVCIRVRMKMDAMHAASIRYGVQTIEPMSERMSHARLLIVRLRNYPLMLIFCHMAAVINRAYQLFAPPVMWFNVVQILFLSVQGLVTASIFACTPEVCSVLMRPPSICRVLCRCFCRCCPRCCACGQRVGQQGLCGLLATTAMDGAHEFEPLSLDEEGLPPEPGETGHGTATKHATKYNNRNSHNDATNGTASPTGATNNNGNMNGVLDLSMSLGTDTDADDSGLDVELELFGHSNNIIDNDDAIGHHHHHHPTSLLDVSDDSEPELPLGRGRSHRPITGHTNGIPNGTRHLRDIDGL